MAKPPLMFIHGMWSTPHVWNGLAAHYRAQGHEVVAPALPYHDIAPSDPPPPGLGEIGVQTYVDALVDAARALPDVPVIIGHSMGGMLAQRVAEVVQPRGLVLLSPGPTAATGALSFAPMRTLFGVTSKNGWWRQPTKVDAERARWGIFNEVPADIAEREIAALVWDSGRVLFQMAMPFADKSGGTRVDYARLTMPALVMIGDSDRITPIGVARATARKLPGIVDYRELPGVGHWIFHPPVVDRVAAEIDAFLMQFD